MKANERTSLPLPLPPAKVGLLAIAVLVAFALALACGDGQEQSGSTLISEGAVAPGFRLPAVDGRTVSLSDYAGEKSVLLYFSMGSG